MYELFIKIIKYIITYLSIYFKVVPISNKNYNYIKNSLKQNNKYICVF